jgi:peptidoglycan-N-acetylglucosamine deacetylase
VLLCQSFIAFLHAYEDDRGCDRRRPLVNDLPCGSGASGNFWKSREARPLAGAHATWDCWIASVRSIAAERTVFCFLACFTQRPSTTMSDENRTRPPFGAPRAGYAPRYQPRSLVPSRSAAPARSERSSARTGGGKKEIFCAIGVDVDAVAGWLGSYGGENSPCDISRGLFAGEIGVPRLVKLFDRLGIRTSWFIPGHSIDTFPTQCKMVVDAGHEIGMHGYSHENPIAMTPEQEEAVMDRCIELIERISGRRPTGYVAPWWEFSTVTNELLLRKGIKYDHSLMNDDFHPFYVRVGDSWTPIDYSKHPNEWMRPLVRGEETDLIDIPGSWYLDDLPPMMFIKSAPNSHGFVKPRDIEELWCDQFDWVYREYDYAVFAMTIHPDVSGRPQVLLMLERMYDYLSKHAGVKFCTFDEIADDFRRRCPRESAPAAQAARAR